MMNPLLPDRHRNIDFFVCDVLDAVPKDDLASMEHPIFSLSTKHDTSIREYEHNDAKVTIVPSALGLATIHDKDILIYCISQLITKINQGDEPSRTVRLKAYDLLVATNRETSGDGYRRLKEAFERLAGTRITTNIRTDGVEEINGFGLIDAWKIRVNDPKTARMVELEVNLSEWMFRAILGKEVLTISRDYFRLRKPLERRMYELARKHCGKQEEWVISMELLRKKCGSASTDKEFRRMVAAICEENELHDHFPDYTLALCGEKVRFINRQNKKPPALSKEVQTFPVFDPEIYHDAKLVAPGYDIYRLEQEWRDFWVDTGKPELRDPGAAFIAFCKKRHERNPNP